MVYIYVLIDPHTEEVRYVGKTEEPVERRLSRHMRRTDASDTHKNRWLITLKKQGLQPEIMVVEEVARDRWKEAEKSWIAYFKAHGAPLTNIRNGGQGWSKGQPMPEETKEKIGDWHRGKTLSPETRKKISESSPDRSGHNNPNYGKKHDKETRKKISAKVRGAWKRPEYREKQKKAIQNRGADWRRKQSLAHMGNTPSEEDLKKRAESNGKLSFRVADEIRQRYEEEDITYEELGNEYGVSGASISDIINMKSYKRSYS